MTNLLQNVFEKSTRIFPNNIAIVEEDGRSISYAALDRLATRFANVVLDLKGCTRTRPFIGILSHVQINSIAAVLGTLKAGCAYVPLDESSPKNRLLNIIEQAQLELIIVDPRLYQVHKELFHDAEVSVLFLSEPPNKPPNKPSNKPSNRPTDKPSDKPSDKPRNNDRFIPFERVLAASSNSTQALTMISDNLAYVLHSSGSTGIPKGIMLSHRNARTFVDWMQKEFMLTPNDVVMSRAPFKFDLSVFDIFNTLGAGARLVCFDWHVLRENKHESYVAFMEKSRATVLYATPSTFISLLNRGHLGKRPLDLRQIIYAGEPFAPPLLRRLMSRLPGLRVANVYGPTETNVVSCYHVKQIPVDDSPIPIGRPIDDTDILVVSADDHRICRPNEAGEIWCRGGTVTLGYLAASQLTARSQAQSPVHGYPAVYWRTGDYGYQDIDGLLHYTGRRDHMVKVKGYRIELGEIESSLAKDERLDKSCVVAVADQRYGHRLVCFYSLLDSSDSLEHRDIETRLSRHLPSYMMPYAFVLKHDLPITSAGKIDRVLLSNEATVMMQETSITSNSLHFQSTTVDTLVVFEKEQQQENENVYSE